ncbi:hypothetical protein HGRIS_004262 [Hohenbuehelia grisea]|uniref:Uncharacterized protein n=1 Tax=Hohenbuehelia grisea TaxID=104357 RepID=A0ABR3IP96_9AGAR
MYAGTNTASSVSIVVHVSPTSDPRATRTAVWFLQHWTRIEPTLPHAPRSASLLLEPVQRLHSRPGAQQRLPKSTSPTLQHLVFASSLDLILEPQSPLAPPLAHANDRVAASHCASGCSITTTSPYDHQPSASLASCPPPPSPSSPSASSLSALAGSGPALCG